MALVPGGVRLAVLSVSRFKHENPVEHLTADADVGKKAENRGRKVRYLFGGVIEK